MSVVNGMMATQKGVGILKNALVLDGQVLSLKSEYQKEDVQENQKKTYSAANKWWASC